MSDKKDDHAGKKALAAGFVAAQASRPVKSHLLGYHEVFHGTSNSDIAANIRKKGLKKSKGGTGVSVSDDINRTAGTTDNVKRSKGKVYLTKARHQAEHYTKGIFGIGNPNNVIEATIPHKQYHKAKVDGLSKKLLNKHTPDFMAKRVAHMSGKSVPPSQIKGEKYKGTKQFATKKHMKEFLSHGSGRKRFATGLASATLAGGAATYGAKKLVEKVRGSRES